MCINNIYAINANTKQEIWKAETNADEVFIDMKLEDEDLIATDLYGRKYILDPDTGKQNM